jgi:hypothetical protein
VARMHDSVRGAVTRPYSIGCLATYRWLATPRDSLHAEGSSPISHPAILIACWAFALLPAESNPMADAVARRGSVVAKCCMKSHPVAVQTAPHWATSVVRTCLSATSLSAGGGCLRL